MGGEGPCHFGKCPGHFGGWITGAIGTIISLSFMITYAVALGKLNGVPEGDRCVAYEDREYIDVYPKWKVTIDFGVGMWAAILVCSLFHVCAGSMPVTAGISCFCNICCYVPLIVVQSILLGVYRFVWYGAVCAESGVEDFQSVGGQMMSLFIGQMVMLFMFPCIMGCGTVMNVKNTEKMM